LRWQGASLRAPQKIHNDALLFSDAGHTFRIQFVPANFVPELFDDLEAIAFTADRIF